MTHCSRLLASFAALAMAGECAVAQVEGYQQRALQALTLEAQLFNARTDICQYALRQGELAIERRKYGTGDDRDGLICPQLNNDNRSTWAALRQSYFALLKDVEQRANAPDRTAKATAELSDMVYRAGRVFACDFARHGREFERTRQIHQVNLILSRQAQQQQLAKQAEARLNLLDRLAAYRSASVAPGQSACTASNGPRQAAIVAPPPQRVRRSRPAKTATPPVRAGVAKRGQAVAIPEPMWQAMKGVSWHPRRGCPARKNLSLLRIPYLDYAGTERRGEMIVAKSVAGDVLDIFAELFKEGFQIAGMRPVYTFEGDDNKSMAANNTSAFNCRAVTGGRRLSEHAFGRAIDINPIENPYVRRGRVVPGAGRDYARPKKREEKIRGLIRSNGIVVKAFKRKKWKWGGNWRSAKDYQHFSRSGR